MLEHNRIRILHVVGSMDRGGIETWLMQVLRQIDRSRFEMHFLVHTERECAYDDEIRSLGSRIVRCLHPTNPFRYARRLHKILREGERYDVVHSHVHYYSGLVLRIARHANIPLRIAHSHIDTSSVDCGPQVTIARRLYLAMMRRWIEKSSNIRLACSKTAAMSLYGKADSLPSAVMPYLCDVRPFQETIDREFVRNELHIPQNAFVVGHVGRFEEQKNHVFFVQIAVELLKLKPEAHFLMVGVGPLLPEIQQRVAAAGLTGKFTFTGSRSDVPRLMLGGMDVFLFPSLYEGLGLVLVEAQAAGLRCFYSSSVPEDADLIQPLLRRIPLNDPPVVWAQAIFQASRTEKPMEQTAALREVQNSRFAVKTALQSLQSVYLQ